MSFSLSFALRLIGFNCKISYQCNTDEDCQSGKPYCPNIHSAVLIELTLKVQRDLTSVMYFSFLFLFLFFFYVFFIFILFLFLFLFSAFIKCYARRSSFTNQMTEAQSLPYKVYVPKKKKTPHSSYFTKARK